MLEIICDGYQHGVWISALPSYQQHSINEQLKNGFSNDEIAQFWASGITTLSLAPFGGLPPKNFYDAFKVEFKAFICGDEKYSTLRNKVTQSWASGKVLVISTIATAIAATIGVAVALVTPLVAVFLEIACTIGLNTWCQLNAAI